VPESAKALSGANPVQKFSGSVWAVLCLVFVLTCSGTVIAQSRLTNATFSGPVQLPGVLLPAGSYRFSVASDRRSVVVSNSDNRIVTTLVVVPVTRSTVGETITMLPAVGGAAPEVTALYSGGGTTGVRFVHRAAQQQ